ncbi:nuclear transport factor 2 family protein [Oleomonas cavernae]|uniref:Nuclear transport factor 2 family protein n=1 Tax=Oleomonas cavernae TaxID=2320859 RepID=A0A418WTE6_9PROT|nr:nuclear transport factor 2 family protein [Oleomonas cavernae]RJF94439.1 nuclear transport factor 2 family protein [Oleomonas cavernae]
MPLQLAPAIERYFAAEHTDDPAALARCFAPDATIRDEGHIIEGLAAIAAWKAATKAKYQHTTEPLDAAEQDGRTIVTAKVTGNFPGSPVNLAFAFGLLGGKIVSLEIG